PGLTEPALQAECVPPTSLQAANRFFRQSLAARACPPAARTQIGPQGRATGSVGRRSVPRRRLARSPLCSRPLPFPRVAHRGTGIPAPYSAPSHALHSVGLRKAAPTLLAITVQGQPDDGQGRGRRSKLIHLDRLAFERLVILEKATQQGQAVGGQPRGLAKAVVFRVIDRHGPDLVIALAG